MDLPGLFFLFAAYTLVVAAVVVATMYFTKRQRREKRHGLPIPNVAGLNVRTPAERKITAWPAQVPATGFEGGTLQDPRPGVLRTISRPAAPAPVDHAESRRPSNDLVRLEPTRMRGRNLLPERVKGVTTVDAAPALAPSVRSDLTAANPFARAFLPDVPLLPEGLRTLVVTPNRMIEPGMTVRAAVTFRNPGGGVASGFRARFRLLEGLSYVPGSARIDDNVLDEGNSATPLLHVAGADVGDIPAGGERRISLAFTVADTIENGTPIALQAAIASADVPVIGSNVVRLVVRSRPVLNNPRTTLTLVAVRGALPGEDLALTARVHNSGQSSAHDLMALLPVPAHTSFCAGSVSIDGRPFGGHSPDTTFGFARPTVIAPVLEPGATVEIAYRVRIDTPLEDATPIVVEGSVCSQEVAEFALSPVRLEIPSAASFDGDQTALRVECAEEVAPGERLRINLRATNVGTAAARDLSLAIELPSGMIYTAGSLTIDGALVPDRGSVGAAIALGDLSPRRAVDLALTAIVQSPIPDGHKLRPAARVTWSKGERRFARDIVARSAPRFPAEFNKIERESTARVRPSDPVSYTLALANMGTDSATNVRIKLTADPGLEALRVRDGEREIPIAADFTIGLETLEPGVSRLLRISGRIAAIVEDQKQLRLHAALQSEQVNYLELGTPTHSVESRPKFSLTTSRLSAETTQTLRFNRVSTCRLLLLNEGTDCGRDVRVTLVLPDELRLEGVDNATLDGSAIIFGDIPAGEKRDALLHVRLVGIVGGEPLAVAARVGGVNVVPFSLTSIEFATYAEASFADGATLTSVPAQTVDAGAEIAYTLVLRNSGDGAAKHLTARIARLTNAVYAQGTTTVNGIALQDHAGTSLLLSDAGLRLADVGAGVEIVASWRAIVNMPLPPGTTIDSIAAVHWDDAGEFSVAATPVSARSTSALPVMDPVLPFSVLGAIAARIQR
jgi:uncharacterized repeat protein (TIGR01451 family)